MRVLYAIEMRVEGLRPHAIVAALVEKYDYSKRTAERDLATAKEILRLEFADDAADLKSQALAALWTTFKLATDLERPGDAVRAIHEISLISGLAEPIKVAGNGVGVLIVPAVSEAWGQGEDAG